MAKITANSALQELAEGNRRFASDRVVSHAHVERVRALVLGQEPFATVLACADSRVPVETLFDREPGDIFVVRLAGNFMSEAALASIEYAVALLSCPLVMVLGHTSCGAVRAAMDFVESGTRLAGHMQVLADAIVPAAQAARSDNGDWWRNAVAENARRQAAHLRDSTPILRDAVERKRASIVAAVFDLNTGLVSLV